MQNLILGPDGNPIKPDDSCLPNEVQALIESKVTAGIVQVSDKLREEFTSKQRWMKIAAISAILAVMSPVLSWLYGPTEVKNWTRQFVADHMNKPFLKQTADEVIRSEMANYVTEKIGPLNRKADALSHTITHLSSQLLKNQNIIQNQLHIQQLAIDAKAGSRKDYEELTSLANTDASAKAARKEVDLFYDADSSKLIYPILVDPESQEDPGISVDEAVAIFSSRQNVREFAANTLANLKEKKCVAVLCNQIPNEQDLHAIERIIRAINVITNNTFKPLDISSVLAWWHIHSNDSQYYNPYSGLVAAMHIDCKSTHDIEMAISKLDETLKNDPKAIYALCMKGELLAILGKLDESQVVFTAAKMISVNYRFIYAWEALLRIKQGQTENAIDLVNKALARSPALEQFFKMSPFFASIVGSPKIKWPPNKT